MIEDKKTLEDIIRELSKQNGKINFPTDFQCEIAIDNLKSSTTNDYKKKFSNEELDNKLHSQQELLQNCILSNGTQNFFNIFNMGCSAGKTYVAVNSMPYYLRNVARGLIPRKGVLFVIRQTDEIDKYADFLNSLFVDYFTGYQRQVALSYHSKKYTNDFGKIDSELRQELLKKVPFAPIVFMSHENYINLSENTELQKVFSQGRRLLIIDESVDICEIVKIATIRAIKEDVTFNQIEQLLDYLIDEEKILFEEITRPLLNKYNQLKNENEDKQNVSFNFKNIDNERMNKNINKLLKLASGYNSEIQKSLETILKYIKLLYTDTCIINQNKANGLKDGYIEIKTINRKKQMWTLDNNIILDASASIDPKYKFNTDLYFMMNNECVLDYSKWSIRYVFESSTKTSKFLDKKFKTPEERKKIEKKYNAYSQIINDLGEKETLVICSKDEHIIEDKIGNEERCNPYKLAKNLPLDNIEHFGNITGKREFENLKNVLIAHTPNFQDSDYILHYMYYKNIKFEDNSPLLNQTQINSLGGIYMFDNQELQDTKEMIIANQIYQAVCRVNREMEYDTNVVIVSKYIGAILYVRDMLKGCSCEQTNKYDEVFGTGINKVNEERKENSQKNQLRKIFKEILNGNIRDEIEYKSIDPFIISVHKDCFMKILKFEKDKQLSDAISDNKEFMKENAIIYQDNVFTFILNTKVQG